MSAPLKTARFSASLLLDSESPVDFPPAIHREILLGDIPASQLEADHLFATDDAGRIVGIASGTDIRERLSAPDEREQERWRRMPLASLVHVSFPLEHAGKPAELPSMVDCTAITDHGRVIGIVTPADVFLSWQQLRAVISGAMLDPLTGLMNRLAYERRLHEEWSRAQRTGCSIAVIIVDLDRFKSINDVYGHAAGDLVIREVAGRLEQSLRSYDVVARYGGDEFIGLCVGCRPSEIDIPLQRIQENLRASEIDADGRSLPISASIGAAVRHSDFWTTSPAELFAAADECLYRAKQFRGTAFRVEQGNPGAEEPLRVALPDGDEGEPGVAAHGPVAAGNWGGTTP